MQPLSIRYRSYEGKGEKQLPPDAFGLDLLHLGFQLKDLSVRDIWHVNICQLIHLLWIAGAWFKPQ